MALYLHAVVGVLVVKDEGLLAELVVSLQLVDVGLVVDDVLLVLLQAVHLFLQGAGDVHRHMANLLQEHTRRRVRGAVYRETLERRYSRVPPS